MKKVHISLTLLISCTFPLFVKAQLEQSMPKTTSSSEENVKLPQCSNDEKVDRLIEELAEQKKLHKALLEVMIAREARAEKHDQAIINAQRARIAAQQETQEATLTDEENLQKMWLPKRWACRVKNRIFQHCSDITEQDIVNFAVDAVISVSVNQAQRAIGVKASQEIFGFTDRFFGNGGDWAGMRVFGKPLGVRPGEFVGFASKDERIQRKAEAAANAAATNNEHLQPLSEEETIKYNALKQLELRMKVRDELNKAKEERDAKIKANLEDIQARQKAAANESIYHQKTESPEGIDE